MDAVSVKEVISDYINEIYNFIANPIPPEYRIFINICFYTLLIAFYAIFIWKFYRFLAKRDVIKLDLNKYNRVENPGWHKFFAAIVFLFEYIIIIPFIIFFWFTILSLFLLVLSKDQNVSQILLISTAIVAATRLTAYYSEDLSKDLAKMFPFTLLGIFILDPDFFSLQEIVGRFLSIPSLLRTIFIYLVFIFFIEAIIRFLATIMDFFKSGEDSEDPY